MTKRIISSASNAPVEEKETVKEPELNNETDTDTFDINELFILIEQRILELEAKCDKNTNDIANITSNLSRINDDLTLLTGNVVRTNQYNVEYFRSLGNRLNEMDELINRLPSIIFENYLKDYIDKSIDGKIDNIVYSEDGDGKENQPSENNQ